MSKTQSKYLYPLLFAVGVIFILLALSIIFEIYKSPFWIDEGGVVENATVLGYVLCVVYIIIKGGLDYIKKYPYFVLIPILFALRELDFDKRFTTMGILKLKFYFSDKVPLNEKIVGLLVIALLAYVVISIIKNHLKDFLINLKQGSPVAIGALLIFLAAGISKSVDGIGRKLSSLGINISENFSNIALVVEEILELGIPILLLATYYVYFSMQNSKKEIK